MKLRYILCVLITFSSVVIFGKEYRKIVDLNTNWKFEIGDDSTRSRIDFDDTYWEEINVPSSWEDQGFPGYDGYAWYRIKFNVDEEFRNRSVILHLGWIDDVDETFLNGELVGYSGGFPPKYYTNAHSDRKYMIPNEIVNFGGENVLAIRVYDHSGTGGIVRGRNGIYVEKDELVPDIKLASKWKFQTGDKPEEWKAVSFDDSTWEELKVPTLWDYQGYKDYDGIAWYRTKVFIPKDYKEKRLILLVGKIDDLDETYINGQLVGSTGKIEEDYSKIWVAHEFHQKLRAYYISPNVLKYGEENVIAVRVYDGTTYGGIYEGPLGIVSRKKFIKWKEAEENLINKLIDALFGE